jgi:hypothetical protein
MQSPETLRRLAERCVRLSEATDSRKVASMLIGFRQQLLDEASQSDLGQRHIPEAVFVP